MKMLLITILGCLILFGCSNKPSDIEGWRKAGQDAFLAGKYREAREALSEGLALKPSDQNMLYYMGLAFEREYVYDSALFYLNKVNILYPNQREIVQEIYEVAPKVESWDDAVNAIRSLVRNGDPEEKYWEELVDYHDRRGYTSLSYYYAQRLHAREPDNLEWYIRTSSAAITLDSLDVASAILDSAEQRFGPRIEFTSGRGIILLKKGEFETAEKLFRGLHKEDSTSLYFNLYLGSALAPQASVAKKEEALGIFKSIRDQSSDQPRIDSMITTLRYDLGLE